MKTADRGVTRYGVAVGALLEAEHVARLQQRRHVAAAGSGIVAQLNADVIDRDVKSVYVGLVAVGTPVEAHEALGGNGDKELLDVLRVAIVVRLIGPVERDRIGRAGSVERSVVEGRVGHAGPVGRIEIILKALAATFQIDHVVGVGECGHLAAIIRHGGRGHATGVGRLAAVEYHVFAAHPRTFGVGDDHGAPRHLIAPQVMHAHVERLVEVTAVDDRTDAVAERIEVFDVGEALAVPIGNELRDVGAPGAVLPEVERHVGIDREVGALRERATAEAAPQADEQQELPPGGVKFVHGIGLGKSELKNGGCRSFGVGRA